MNREMAPMFPSGIRALIVDDDARFIKASSMLLSLLNFKVASCGSPTSALKLLSGDMNKDVDVVLINAVKATTCGFNFRGIVESDLGIPVIYFLSRDHVAAGDEADELLRTLRDSTYVLRSPFQANDVCDLWTVIAWRKCYLENKAKGADRGRVVPAAVHAFMAGGSTTVDEEDEGRIHFKVVGAGGRGRKRKSGSSNNTVGSSGNTVSGDQTAKRPGKMDVTGGHEMEDDVSSQQQPTPQKNRAPAAALPFVRQQQSAAATTIEATATTSRCNQPAAGDVAPAPLTAVANHMATTVTYEPAEFSSGSHQQQQQQQPVCPPLMFGPFPYQGPRPPVPAMFMPLPRHSGTPPRRGTESIGGATVAADAREYGNSAANSLLQSLNLGTEPHGRHDEQAAMMAMYTESNPPVADASTAALHNDNSKPLMAPQQQHVGHGVPANRAESMGALNTNSYTNFSTAAAVAPQHVGHGVAPKHAAARQEVLNNGDNFSTYSTSPNQVLDMASNVNELTVAGGAFFGNATTDSSLTAPQDLAGASNGDQLAPGALDAISASLMGSPGPGAAMDGNPAGLQLETMFSPDQYDNTMFPLEALLGLDDASVYDSGVDYQLGGAAGGTGDDAAGTSLIGGADNLDIMDDYLFMDSTGDFNIGRE